MVEARDAAVGEGLCPAYARPMPGLCPAYARLSGGSRVFRLPCEVAVACDRVLCLGEAQDREGPALRP